MGKTGTKIEAEREALARAVSLAAAAVDRSSTVQILSHVLLTPHGDGLRAVGTDMNLTVVAHCRAKGKWKDGIALPARSLTKVLRAVAADTVTMKVTDAGWVEIHSGRTEYTLPGLPSRDFPAVMPPEQSGSSPWDSPILRELIDKTEYSASKDTTRAHLMGALFESDGGCVRMVSTDGHRLTKAEKEIADAPSASAVIPSRALRALSSLLDGREAPCQLLFESDFFTASADGTVVRARLAGGAFPPWEQVVPQGKPDATVTLSRLDLHSGLRRSCLMATEAQGVALSVESKGLRIKSDNPDQGTYDEVVEGRCQGKVDTVGVNGGYLMDFLSHTEVQDVTLELAGALEPIVVRTSGDYLGVIMPVRL